MMSSLAMRKALVVRFAIAMLIMLATTIGSFFAVHYQLRQNLRDGYLINISGRQRMLSQRIALLSTQIAANSDDSSLAAFRNTLKNAIDRMDQSHHELREHAEGATHHSTLSAHAQESVKLSEIMSGPEGLDRRVNRFLALARTSLDAGEDRDDATIVTLVAMSMNEPLLGQLDSYVAQLQSIYDAKMSRCKRILMSLAALSFVTLAMIVQFIFRPTVRLVGTNVERLEESNSELTEFSYRVSHDLRSPVVASIGLTQVAQDALDEGDAETAVGAIGRVHQSLSRVAITIEDIVSLIKQKMIDVESETFCVSEIVEESLESARSMQGADAVQLEVTCSKDCEVRTKRVYLKQSIENLLTNAVKYHDPKADQSVVRVDVEVEGTDCRVSIADNGLGIREDCRDKVFKMFQRFHPNVSFGTGLGLYLVAKNVEALDGSVAYEPLDKGSRFEIQFPTQKA